MGPVVPKTSKERSSREPQKKGIGGRALPVMIDQLRRIPNGKSGVIARRHRDWRGTPSIRFRQNAPPSRNLTDGLVSGLLPGSKGLVVRTGERSGSLPVFSGFAAAGSLEIGVDPFESLPAYSKKCLDVKITDRWQINVSGPASFGERCGAIQWPRMNSLLSVPLAWSHGEIHFAAVCSSGGGHRVRRS